MGLSMMMVTCNKGAYIKYVGGAAGGFYNFFKKYFVAQ